MSALRDTWLHIASNGGRWKPREVSQALPHLSKTRMAALLRDMARNGLVVRYRTGTRFSYGVCATCRIPRGISLKDIQGVLA